MSGGFSRSPAFLLISISQALCIFILYLLGTSMFSSSLSIAFFHYRVVLRSFILITIYILLSITPLVLTNSLLTVAPALTPLIISLLYYKAGLLYIMLAFSAYFILALLYKVTSRVTGFKGILEYKPTLSTARIDACFLGASLIAIGLSGLFLGSYLGIAYGSVYIWLVLSIITAVAASSSGFSGKVEFIVKSIGCTLGPNWLSVCYTTHAIEESHEESCVGFELGSIVAVLSKGRGVEWPSGKPCLASSEWRWIKLGRESKLCLDLERARNQHIAIFGETGSGKSSLARRIAYEALRNGWCTIVFDFHGEHHVLSEYGFRVVSAEDLSLNPFELYGESPYDKAVELAYVFSNALSLGPMQRSVLIDSIVELYRLHGIYEEDESTWGREPPTMEDFLKLLIDKARSSNESIERSRLLSIYRQLSSIYTGFKGRFSWSRILESKAIVIDFSGLSNEKLQSLHGELIFRMLYNRLRESSSKSMIIIDEAHRLVRGGGFINKAVAESRKYGLSIVMITQNPLDLGKNVLVNTATKVVFKLTDTSIIDYVSTMITPSYEYSVVKTVKQALKILPVGYAVISSEAINNLIVFRVKEL